MTAAANRLSLRGYSLYNEMMTDIARSPEDFDTYLESMGLLQSKFPCPKCGGEMRLKRATNNMTNRWICHRQACRDGNTKVTKGYLTGTFFENQRSERKKLWMLSLMWADDMGTVEQMGKHCGIDSSTIVQWNQYFRDVCSQWQQTRPQIGGIGRTVNVDETYLGKRKYNRGRVVRTRALWVVGVVDITSGAAFMEVVPDRTAGTLEGFLQAHVLPGTRIHSDCFASYNGLGNLGFIHSTVNHSANFVDPASGTHTQFIESRWNQLKRMVKKRCGLNNERIDDILNEHIFKYECQRNNEDTFYLFWEKVARLYPCH